MPAPKRSWRLVIVVALLSAAAILFLPEWDSAPRPPARRAAFAWGQDALWAQLEQRYDRARDEGCEPVDARIRLGLGALDASLDAISSRSLTPSDPSFRRTESALFDVAPLVAACPRAHLTELVERVSRLRRVVKDQSLRWDVDARASRETLYRLLYGGRAALEEILLQAPSSSVPALIMGINEPSRTPSVTVRGVRLHSGDILLSRGGAPTSAFIARGNDFPGNFSHVALVHVGNGRPTIIESHIERGVALTTASQYLADVKLRIAVIRLRTDHPALERDPMLPHAAASEALAAVRRAHIPYDFAMDYDDARLQFCSEVASAAYARHRVRLWRGLSTMSSPGLARWLGAFGVRHFETLAPSDLEYDPQVRVVAEWRDPDALFADHLDNAVLDAMLEGAERGDNVGYRYVHLPVARVLKGYSAVLNLFGGVGPVPEGMSATTALRADWLRSRHAEIRRRLERRVAAYRREHGRRPPYWTLVRLARESARL